MSKRDATAGLEGAPAGGGLFVVLHSDHVILQLGVLRYNLVHCLIPQRRDVRTSMQTPARPRALSAVIKDARGCEDESDRDLPSLQGVLSSTNGTEMYINVTEEKMCTCI